MKEWTLLAIILAFFLLLYTIGDFMSCYNMSNIKVIWCEKFL
jgi:hypothetical protein